MRVHERFLNYVRINTTSAEGADLTPSTACQFDLANLLADEMRGLGMTDVEVDKLCYVYGFLPATAGHEGAKSIGLIAHMDTAPDFPGENVKPRVIENYDGEDIALGDSGVSITKKMFPHLPALKGRTLIVTDGTTLLGADDKAGIAVILTLIEELQKTGAPHGRVCVCFTPDEEIGSEARYLDLEKFGADFAYTMDGAVEGEVVYENFNACSAKLKFSGFNIHPGNSKDAMINAALVAMELNSMLPAGDTPRDTEGREGFFHLTYMSGNVEHAELSYIIRDHDAAKFEMRQEILRHAAALLNAKYGEGTVGLTFAEQYRNMAEKIFPENMYVFEAARDAIIKAGLPPVTDPVRGGTDGAALSWRGLPCPNIGTGGYGFHGPCEHITVEGMEKTVEVLHNIVESFM